MQTHRRKIRREISIKVEGDFNTEFEYITLLQPTSPLRMHQDIRKAFNELETTNADAIISVCEVEHSPLWSNTIPRNGSLKNFIKDEVKGKRSQDLPVHYRLNGAIYICNTSRFKDEKSLFIENNIFSYVMETKNSIDIDTKFDFRLAEFIKKDSEK